MEAFGKIRLLESSIQADLTKQRQEHVAITGASATVASLISHTPTVLAVSG